jgi:hypothetical protein
MEQPGGLSKNHAWQKKARLQKLIVFDGSSCRNVLLLHIAICIYKYWIGCGGTCTEERKQRIGGRQIESTGKSITLLYDE